MTDWDSAYLLAQFKAEAGLQAASEYDDTLDLFPRIARAQPKVIRRLAQRYAKAFYQAPIIMTPSVDRKTFTFGTDGNNNPIVPQGWVQIAPNANAFSGDNFVGWVEGRDFLDEGAQIRMPSGRAYSGTLYARFVPTPPSITAAVQPVLMPAEARNLIVLQAVKDWAGEGNIRPDLVDRMNVKIADEFPDWMLTYKQRYKGGGGLIDPSRWYFSAPDLGSTGS